MVLKPGSDGWIVQASVVVSEMDRDSQTACGADRAAVLVAYTLLGAAINGFAPVGPSVSNSAADGLFPHCRRN